MGKRLFAILLAIAAFALCGCEESYSEADIEDAKQQAYSEGYEDGYSRGTEAQREKDCEDFLIDGQSIRDIDEQVYIEYGLTPAQAFGIVDEYEYDSSHGGFTWAEYQYAIEVIYYTASIFPSID